MVRDLKIVQPPTSSRVDLHQLCADNCSGKVICHQPANDAGLQNVLAYLRQAPRRRSEVSRDDISSDEAALDDFDEANVGRE